jgi:maleylpyruvate isomerase
VKLYSYWRSSASWRVRIALAYKGIDYQYQAVHLMRDGGEQYAPDYKTVNPMSQVPVLELDSDPAAPGSSPRRIAQSIAILEYLEERYPTPPLLPKDPWQRARVRQLAELVNSGMQPFQNVPVLRHVKETLKADEQAWVRHFVGRGLQALERTAAETAGKFLVGDQPTFADVCLVPQLYGARRYGVDLTETPILVRVEAACNALAAFSGAHADLQPDATPPRP